MIIKESISGDISALAAAIHYPECWDTAAYPDLLSALREVTASAGCSACKSPVEQEPVAWLVSCEDNQYCVDSLDDYQLVSDLTNHGATCEPLYRHPAPDQQRPTILSASARHFRQMQNEVESLAQERYKLIQAVADHVTVRAEQHQKIQALEAQARDHLVQLGAERNRALTAECERDALREQVRVLSDALTELHDDMADRFDMNDPSTNPGIKEGIEQAAAALAAVREPADHIEHDLEMVPAPACWLDRKHQADSRKGEQA